VKSNLFDQEATVLQFNMRAMEDREENLSFYFSLNIIREKYFNFNIRLETIRNKIWEL
jgi:hypothetical protein